MVPEILGQARPKLSKTPYYIKKAVGKKKKKREIGFKQELGELGE